jgi:hypothetical protein
MFISRLVPSLLGSKDDGRLGMYIHEKHQRPDNWGDTNTDFQQPLLILLLLVVWIIVTGVLAAFYWPSYGWALEMTHTLWESGGFWRILSPCVVALWLFGLVVCGAPPFVLVCLAIFA